MSNAMKYVKLLESAGFDRNQAEAQVQMMLDVLQGELMTKHEFAVFAERIDHRFREMDFRFEQIEQRFGQEIHQINSQIHSQIQAAEFRLTSRLGVLMVSTISIAVAILAWLIKF